LEDFLEEKTGLLACGRLLASTDPVKDQEEREDRRNVRNAAAAKTSAGAQNRTVPAPR
jgi:hypothetical protein